MGSTAWNDDGLARLEALMARHVEQGDAEGLAWLVARHGEVHAGAAGVLEPAATHPWPATASSGSRR